MCGVSARGGGGGRGDIREGGGSLIVRRVTESWRDSIRERQRTREEQAY